MGAGWRYWCVWFSRCAVCPLSRCHPVPASTQARFVLIGFQNKERALLATMENQREVAGIVSTLQKVRAAAHQAQVGAVQALCLILSISLALRRT